MDFEAFWARYLAAHRDPRTRALHVAGTIAASALVGTAIAFRKPWLAVAGLVAGYGPAWFAHAVFERNRPATFQAPVASFVADYFMAWHVLRGTIDAELFRVVKEA
ncbi:MAG: Mpo1-like protein [Vulcanimicrobiaceae bacterium]